MVAAKDTKNSLTLSVSFIPSQSVIGTKTQLIKLHADMQNTVRMTNFKSTYIINVWKKIKFY
jgi:hypothetical protein